jgi:hypothetical protein
VERSRAGRSRHGSRYPEQSCCGLAAQRLRRLLPLSYRQIGRGGDLSGHRTKHGLFAFHNQPLARALRVPSGRIVDILERDDLSSNRRPSLNYWWSMIPAFAGAGLFRKPVSTFRDHALSGKRSVTAETALRLGRYFGNALQFCINLQARIWSKVRLAVEARLSRATINVAGRGRSCIAVNRGFPPGTSLTRAG